MNEYKKRRFSPYQRAFASFVAAVFLLNSVILPTPGFAQIVPQTILNLPLPGTMVPLTPSFTPAMIKGITLHPKDPLLFDFIIHPGDENLQDEALRSESTKLIKYFMAALTVPEDQMWVNLSPYEKDRIIPDGFGQTAMGRDLLAQDYILKQLTASLVYPEDELGSEFWKRVKKEAYEKYGATDLPMNTFNKVWIVPQRATVFESGESVFVTESYLKVMLEEDYLALDANKGHSRHGLGDISKGDLKGLSEVSKKVIREIILPEIEREVNEGKTFASLRQIYNAVILATWYKENLKQSILGQSYINQNKTTGINIKDPQISQKIYDQYIRAFQQGVYNFIKEDYDPVTQEIIPRKFFSGGAIVNPRAVFARSGNDGRLATELVGAHNVRARINGIDAAMSGSREEIKARTLSLYDQEGVAKLLDRDGAGRMAEYAIAIAKQLGLSDEEQDIVWKAGLIHDLGRRGVSFELADKVTALARAVGLFKEFRMRPHNFPIGQRDPESIFHFLETKLEQVREELEEHVDLANQMGIGSDGRLPESIQLPESVRRNMIIFWKHDEILFEVIDELEQEIPFGVSQDIINVLKAHGLLEDTSGSNDDELRSLDERILLLAQVLKAADQIEFANNRTRIERHRRKPEREFENLHPNGSAKFHLVEGYYSTAIQLDIHVRQDIGQGRRIFVASLKAVLAMQDDPFLLGQLVFGRDEIGKPDSGVIESVEFEALEAYIADLDAAMATKVDGLEPTDLVIDVLQHGIVDAQATDRINVTEVAGLDSGATLLEIGRSIKASRTYLPGEKIDLEQLIEDMRIYHGKKGFGMVLVSDHVNFDLDNNPRNREILEEALESSFVAKTAFEALIAGRPLENRYIGDIIAAVLKKHLKKAAANGGPINVSLAGKMDLDIIKHSMADEIERDIDIEGEDREAYLDANQAMNRMRRKAQEPFETLQGRAKTKKRYIVLTGGGPASGHNQVLGAMIWQAERVGIEIIGIRKGWMGLADEDLVNNAFILTSEGMKKHDKKGGTILKTERMNPFSEANVEAGVPAQIVRNIMEVLQADGLITMGGDDTNGAALKLLLTQHDLPVIGIPKTMDNDLPLPDQAPTYGYDSFTRASARYLQSVAVDYAREQNKVLVVETFGRSAGFAPLRIGQIIKATRTLIPEVEIDLKQLIEDVRRYYREHGHATIVVSEGIKVNPDKFLNQELIDRAFERDPVAKAAYERALAAGVDQFGHPKLQYAGDIIAAVLRTHLNAGGLDEVMDVKLAGRMDYNYRSADISDSDIEMSAILGKAAIEFLERGESNELLYVDRDGLPQSIPLLNNTLFQIARELDFDEAVYLSLAEMGSYIRAKREEKGLEIEELARRVGIPPEEMVAIEDGSMDRVTQKIKPREVEADGIHREEYLQANQALNPDAAMSADSEDLDDDWADRIADTLSADEREDESPFDDEALDVFGVRDDIDEDRIGDLAQTEGDWGDNPLQHNLVRLREDGYRDLAMISQGVKGAVSDGELLSLLAFLSQINVLKGNIQPTPLEVPVKMDVNGLLRRREGEFGRFIDELNARRGTDIIRATIEISRTREMEGVVLEKERTSKERIEFTDAAMSAQGDDQTSKFIRRLMAGDSGALAMLETRRPKEEERPALDLGALLGTFQDGRLDRLKKSFIHLYRFRVDVLLKLSDEILLVEFHAPENSLGNEITRRGLILADELDSILDSFESYDREKYFDGNYSAYINNNRIFREKMHSVIPIRALEGGSINGIEVQWGFNAHDRYKVIVTQESPDSNVIVKMIGPVDGRDDVVIEAEGFINGFDLIDWIMALNYYANAGNEKDFSTLFFAVMDSLSLGDEVKIGKNWARAGDALIALRMLGATLEGEVAPSLWNDGLVNAMNAIIGKMKQEIKTDIKEGDFLSPRRHKRIPFAFEEVHAWLRLFETELLVERFDIRREFVGTDEADRLKPRPRRDPEIVNKPIDNKLPLTLAEFLEAIEDRPELTPLVGAGGFNRPLRTDQGEKWFPASLLTFDSFLTDRVTVATHEMFEIGDDEPFFSARGLYPTHASWENMPEHERAYEDRRAVNFLVNFKYVEDSDSAINEPSYEFSFDSNYKIVIPSSSLDEEEPLIYIIHPEADHHLIKSGRINFAELIQIMFLILYYKNGDKFDPLFQAVADRLLLGKDTMVINKDEFDVGLTFQALRFMRYHVGNFDRGSTLTVPDGHERVVPFYFYDDNLGGQFKAAVSALFKEMAKELGLVVSVEDDDKFPRFVDKLKYTLRFSRRRLALVKAIASLREDSLRDQLRKSVDAWLAQKERELWEFHTITGQVRVMPAAEDAPHDAAMSANASDLVETSESVVAEGIDLLLSHLDDLDDPRTDEDEKITTFSHGFSWRVKSAIAKGRAFGKFLRARKGLTVIDVRAKPITFKVGKGELIPDERTNQYNYYIAMNEIREGRGDAYELESDNRAFIEAYAILRRLAEEMGFEIVFNIRKRERVITPRETFGGFPSRSAPSIIEATVDKDVVIDSVGVRFKERRKNRDKDLMELAHLLHVHLINILSGSSTAIELQERRLAITGEERRAEDLEEYRRLLAVDFPTADVKERQIKAIDYMLGKLRSDRSINKFDSETTMGTNGYGVLLWEHERQDDVDNMVTDDWEANTINTMYNEVISMLRDVTGDLDVRFARSSSFLWSDGFNPYWREADNSGMWAVGDLIYVSQFGVRYSEELAYGLGSIKAGMRNIFRNRRKSLEALRNELIERLEKKKRQLIISPVRVEAEFQWIVPGLERQLGITSVEDEESTYGAVTIVKLNDTQEREEILDGRHVVSVSSDYTVEGTEMRKQILIWVSPSLFHILQIFMVPTTFQTSKEVPTDEDLAEAFNVGVDWVKRVKEKVVPEITSIIEEVVIVESPVDVRVRTILSPAITETVGEIARLEEGQPDAAMAANKGKYDISDTIAGLVERYDAAVVKKALERMIYTLEGHAPGKNLYRRGYQGITIWRGHVFKHYEPTYEEGRYKAHDGSVQSVVIAAAFTIAKAIAEKIDHTEVEKEIEGRYLKAVGIIRAEEYTEGQTSLGNTNFRRAIIRSLQREQEALTVSDEAMTAIIPEIEFQIAVDHIDDALVLFFADYLLGDHLAKSRLRWHGPYIFYRDETILSLLDSLAFAAGIGHELKALSRDRPLLEQQAIVDPLISKVALFLQELNSRGLITRGVLIERYQQIADGGKSSFGRDRGRYQADVVHSLQGTKREPSRAPATEAVPTPPLAAIEGDGRDSAMISEERMLELLEAAETGQDMLSLIPVMQLAIWRHIDDVEGNPLSKLALGQLRQLQEEGHAQADQAIEELNNLRTFEPWEIDRSQVKNKLISTGELELNESGIIHYSVTSSGVREDVNIPAIIERGDGSRGNTLLRHLASKLLDEHFRATGVYSYPHVPNVIGGYGEGEGYFYEMFEGSDAFAWEIAGGIENGYISTPVRLAEFAQARSAFNSAGIDIGSDIVDVDSYVGKNLVLAGGNFLDPDQPNTWQRIDFDSTSLQFKVDKLLIYLSEREQELKGTLGWKLRLLQLVAKKFKEGLDEVESVEFNILLARFQSSHFWPGSDGLLEESRDLAMGPLGGIDMNPQNIEMEKVGHGVDLQFDFKQENLPSIPFVGFTPVIIQITPITNIPLLLGKKEEESVDELSLLKN